MGVNEFLYVVGCALGTSANFWLIFVLLRPVGKTPWFSIRNKKLKICGPVCYVSSGADGELRLGTRSKLALAEISLDGRHWRVKSISQNIEVNGRQIPHIFQLYDGDRVQVGGIDTVFRDPFFSDHRKPSVRGLYLLQRREPGGASIVYRAIGLESLRGGVVAKVPTPGDLSGIELNAMIEREFEVLAEANQAARVALRPRLFPRAYAVRRASEGLVALVMEKVPGPTLFRAKAAGFTLQDLIDLTLALAEALQVLASIDIVHSDLKPSNVILRGGIARNACIIDFGIAVRTGMVNRCYTRTFKAPEVQKGLPVTPSLDVFLMGVLLKNHCFPALREQEKAYSAFPQLASLCERMVHLDPGERPTAEEVTFEVKRLQGRST